jgi:hypothetical protein
MGTDESRVELAKSLTATTSTVRAVFKKAAHDVPAIYLWSLGTVGELRNKLTLPKELPDSALVCKYGRTKDFCSRTANHGNTQKNGYGRLLDKDLELISFALVDADKTVDAEDEMRSYFKREGSMVEVDLDGQKRQEIVVLKNDGYCAAAKGKMECIHMRYGVQTRMDAKEKESMSKQLELQQKLIDVYEGRFKPNM